MIYLVLAAELGRVKIGHAADPYRRLQFLQTGCPTKLELIGVTDGDNSVERALHQRFADDHVHGEWFKFSAAIEAYAGTLAKPIKCGRAPLPGKLGAWLHENRISAGKFAFLIQTSQATISRVCGGKRKPSYEMMRAIARETGGAVLPNDWFDLSTFHRDAGEEDAA
jgi:hypothetical protein